MPVLIVLGLGALAFAAWLVVQAVNWVAANLWVLAVPVGWLLITIIIARSWPERERRPQVWRPPVPERDQPQTVIHRHVVEHHHIVEHHHYVEHRHVYMGEAAPMPRPTPSLGRGRPELTAPVVVPGQIVNDIRKELPWA
jgi:hypothetical protein